MRFPGFSKASLEWLLDNRDVIGVGVDTISIDIGSLSLDEESPAHYLLFFLFFLFFFFFFSSFILQLE